MFEVERNSPIEAGALSEFFARCGWDEPEAVAKLEWALAASDEWVVCRLDGLLVGFGRSCWLGGVRRVVFDVVIDPRLRGSGLGHEIMRLLNESPASFEGLGASGIPVAPPNTYLGAGTVGPPAAAEDEG